MSEGVKVPLPHARRVANELRDMLLSACERIEIAGSIRREKPEVGDGEIVAVPRIEEGRNLLHTRLDALVEQGRIRRAKITDKNGRVSERWGDDYRAVAYSGMKFDIFMTEVESWGYQFWLRTGPDNEQDKANTFIMTRLKYGKPPFRVEKGKVMVGDQRGPVLWEKEWFALLGLPFIEPKDRRKAVYERYFGKAHKWGNPRALLSTPAPQLRLLWNYKDEILAAYPVPLDFIDDLTGKMWANVTLDRRNGPFELVDMNSREAAYQREFLVGAVQQRVELDRLRQILWKDQEIPVPGYFDMGDLPITYLMSGGGETERVPLSNIIPTQEKVYRWGVYTKVQAGQKWGNWCYSARKWSKEEALADIWGSAKALRFAGSDRVYLVDGHHRFMGAQELKAEWVSANVVTFQETYAQACGMIVADADNTDYEFLNDVMEEALAILAERVPA